LVLPPATWDRRSDTTGSAAKAAFIDAALLALSLRVDCAGSPATPHHSVPPIQSLATFVNSAAHTFGIGYVADNVVFWPGILRTDMAVTPITRSRSVEATSQAAAAEHFNQRGGLCWPKTGTSDSVGNVSRFLAERKKISLQILKSGSADCNQTQEEEPRDTPSLYSVTVNSFHQALSSSPWLFIL